MKKKVAQHVVIMDMFKEIKNSAHDSLTIKEIIDLTGFKYGSVAGRVSELTSIHQFQTAGEGKNKTFRLIKETEGVGNILRRHTTKTIHRTLPIIKPALKEMPIQKKQSYSPPIPKPDPTPLVQRCYYLAKAHAHLTEVIVGDAFNISNEEAAVLMVKVSHRFKDTKLKVILYC